MTIVCAHGDVKDFCESKDMLICSEYTGELADYHGGCRVLVTGQQMTKNEYYYYKDLLMRRGVELVSTEHEDTPEMLEYLFYSAERRKEKYGGRQPFGYQRKNGVVIENAELIKVAGKIIEMRDRGATLREIREFPEIRHLDGRKISVSTIQQIIKNREKYGK
jgi:hypothetical protein